jgi:hypothetical protein
MPGHSLIRRGKRFFIAYGSDVTTIIDNFEHLLNQFANLASGSLPRPWTAAGWGGEAGHFVKIVVSHLAGVLEALQRWEPNAKNGVAPSPNGPPNYQPGTPRNQISDHAIVIALLTDLVNELYGKQNADGSNSGAPKLPAAPSAPYQQPDYDYWVMQMTLLFHDELLKKKGIRSLPAAPAPTPGQTDLFLPYTSVLIVQITQMIR